MRFLVLRKRPQSKCTWTCHKPLFYSDIYRKNAAPQQLAACFEQSTCTWTYRTSHFMQKIQGKCRMPRPQRPFCASLRGRNAHGHVTSHKRNLLRTFRGKVPDTPSSKPVLCKLAPSKCTWACHKTHFWQTCSSKMPPTPDTTSINQRALARTRRTRSVWPHC